MKTLLTAPVGQRKYVCVAGAALVIAGALVGWSVSMTFGTNAASAVELTRLNDGKGRPGLS